MSKKRKPFKAMCTRCQKDCMCLNVVLLKKFMYARFRELNNYCASCRRATRRQWVWPTPTSQDIAHEKAIRAQEAFDS